MDSKSDDGQPNKSGGLDLSDVEIPDEWMVRIAGLVTTTVNAALMDYHNVQGDEIEARIAAIAEERVKEVLEKHRGPVKPEPDDLRAPPRPRTRHGSRRHVKDRVKLQGTCDRALFELFEQDRHARGFNISQMIDFILYNYYGKPRLSFEEDEARPVPEPPSARDW